MTTIDTQKIELVCADDGNIEAISSILMEATNWRIERGIPLWKPEHFTVEKLKPAVERNEFYLAKYEGDTIGTLIFQWEDEFFWPDVPAGESAFLHRIAVRRRVAGQGVVNAMVDWAKGKAQMAGRQYLRLDCDRTQPKLCAYYETLGFRLHSERQMGIYDFARYEIALLSNSG